MRSGDIEVGGYRSRARYGLVLEREGIEVCGYRSRGRQRPVLDRELSGEIAAVGYRSRGR